MALMAARLEFQISNPGVASRGKYVFTLRGLGRFIWAAVDRVISDWARLKHLTPLWTLAQEMPQEVLKKNGGSATGLMVSWSLISIRLCIKAVTSVSKKKAVTSLLPNASHNKLFATKKLKV